MNLEQWLEANRLIGPDITTGERERRRMQRTSTLKKAQTNMAALRIAKSRGSMGYKLAKRLEKASAGTQAEFKVVDQMPELAPKE